MSLAAPRATVLSLRRHRALATLPRIWAARALHQLGIPGCIGLILLLVCSWSGLALHRLQSHPLPRPSEQSLRPDRPNVQAANLPAPRLPRSVDAPWVLRQVQHAALDAGLGWPQADYRIHALSDAGLSTLEIRTTLKGPYPALRKWITTLLDTQPALALRELSLTRPNSDTLDVEAQVTLVVFLADGWPAAEVQSQPQPSLEPASAQKPSHPQASGAPDSILGRTPGLIPGAPPGRAHLPITVRTLPPLMPTPISKRP